MVTIMDNRGYMRVLLYSYYTTITGWGGPPKLLLWFRASFGLRVWDPNLSLARVDFGGEGPLVANRPTMASFLLGLGYIVGVR